MIFSQVYYNKIKRNTDITIDFLCKRLLLIINADTANILSNLNYNHKDKLKNPRITFAFKHLTYKIKSY